MCGQVFLFIYWSLQDSRQLCVLICSLELKFSWEISVHRFLVQPVYVPVISLDSGWDCREFFVLAESQNCVFSGLLAREDC